VFCYWRVYETELRYNTTRTEAELARDKADETYRDALSIYTEAESIRITEVDVDILNEDSNQIKSEVASNLVTSRLIVKQ